MSDAAADGELRQLGGLASAVGAYFVAGLGAARALGITATEAPVEARMLAHAAGCVAFCAVAWFLPPDARVRPVRGIGRGVATYLAFLLPWAPVALFAYPALLRSFGVEFAAQPHLAYFTAPPTERWQFYVVLGAVVLVGPLAEELAFRGYLRELLRGVAGPAAGLYGTALLFGLFHGVQLAAPLALLGWLFGWLRERHGSLAAPWVVHALHNAITVAITMTCPAWLQRVYGG